MTKKKILIESGTESIYRHSSMVDAYVFDIASKKLQMYIRMAKLSILSFLLMVKKLLLSTKIICTTLI